MSPERPQKKFAILADACRAFLVDPDKHHRQSGGFRNPAAKKLVQAMAHELRRSLDRSHMMVLSDEFTALAAQFSYSHPDLLARALSVARMPFDNLWIEWSEHARREAVGHDFPDDPEVSPRVGMLITKIVPDDMETSEMVGTYYAAHIVFSHTEGSKFTTGYIWPAGFVFNLSDPATFMITGASYPSLLAHGLQHHANIGQTAGMIEVILKVKPGIGETVATMLSGTRAIQVGLGYLDTVRKRHGQGAADTATALGSHAYAAAAPPIGSMLYAIYKNPNTSDEAKREAIETLSAACQEINGDFRWLLCVLTMLNLGNETQTHYETQASKRVFLKGKFHPAYEYRVVTIQRPVKMALESVTRRVVGVGFPRRWHTVMGHWARRRNSGDATCPHSWELVRNKKGDAIGSDRQFCKICAMVRWWVPAHGRGHRELGVIDKGYEVKATDLTRPVRKHTTLDAVETDVSRFEPAFHPPDESAKDET